MNANLWLERMLNSSAQGLLFFAVIWVICRTKRLKPQTRQWLWWVGSLKLLFGLFLAIPFVLPAPTDGSTSPIQNFLPQSVPVTNGNPGPAAAGGFDAPAFLLGIWTFGVACFFFRLAIEMKRLRNLLKEAENAADSQPGQIVRRLSLEMGLSTPPRVVTSQHVASPILALPLRPTIVLPTDFHAVLTLEEQEMAIAHELAHLRRRDLWTSIVPALARALFFFLPPAWLAAREFGANVEAACDEEALTITGGARKRYCELLLKMVARDHQPLALPALGATHQFHSLKKRIELMRTSSSPSAKIAAISLAAAIILAIPFRVEADQRQAIAEGGLIDNASFEEGTNLPTGWATGQEIEGVEYLWDRSTAHSGMSSLLIAKTTHKFFPIARWQQSIKYDGYSKELDLSAWVKAEMEYKSILDVEFESYNGTSTHQWAAYIGAEQEGDPPANHNWRRYKGTVQIPANTRRISVCLETYGPGKVWFDDIKALLHN